MSVARPELRSELTHLVAGERSRGLAAREADGLQVQLVLDAFYHPFAHAA